MQKSLFSKITKYLVRITNREDHDLLQKQSDMGLLRLSAPLIWQATSVQNFRKFTAHVI